MKRGHSRQCLLCSDEKTPRTRILTSSHTYLTKHPQDPIKSRTNFHCLLRPVLRRVPSLHHLTFKNTHVTSLEMLTSKMDLNLHVAPEGLRKPR